LWPQKMLVGKPVLIYNKKNYCPTIRNNPKR